MATIGVEIRSGAYFDSVVLMQLQHALSTLPQVLDVGVVMGTEVNKQILAQSDLLIKEAQRAAADDLVIVVRGETEGAVAAALEQVDALLVRPSAGGDEDYRPKSLDAAARLMPDAQWVLISVPGRYAGNVAREALRLGKCVFLYSDNVPVDAEADLKRLANQKGLLLMGPDCGTAIVNAIGLGFANQVRRGPIGIVAASGTGLQQVSSRIHQLGSGVSHALGTGGRDLSQPIAGATTLLCLDLLRRDASTKVIVIVSKPPAPGVTNTILEAAHEVEKPVVVDFIGHAAATRQIGKVHFASTLDEAAEMAVELVHQDAQSEIPPDQHPIARDNIDLFTPQQRYLRGLFSGGTLAYEALLILRDYLPVVHSNIPLHGQSRLDNSLVSQGHTVIDLGEDEFTVGRLHPMMDNTLRIDRLQQEARDPEVAVILLDVVLGHGAHPDPAAELAPAIKAARSTADGTGRHLQVTTVLVGTDEDPQDLPAQARRLREAGAQVFTSNQTAIRSAGNLIRSLNKGTGAALSRPVDLAVLQQPLAAINVGLESFAASLRLQQAPVVQMDWRPPAGGDERLASILERLRQ